jgi:hypothetical protein
MPRDLCRSWPLLAMLACVVGCAGNGEGLDANGQPILPGGGGGAASGPVTADFQSIQDNVFTPICSKCHIGASAPEGLELDAAHSYGLLVGVPSVEEPNLERVDPGNPDQSYMVLKIEGAPGILGGQMPLGETPLPQDTINAIRQWISNGAPKDGSSAAAAAMAVKKANAPAFEIESTSPIDASDRESPLRQIVVAFTHELDASRITDAAVTLQRIDGPAALDGAGQLNGPAALGAIASRDTLVPLEVPVYVTPAAHNPSVLLITPLVPLLEGRYRTTVHGAGDRAVTDLESRPLGADRSFEFSVERAP